MGSAVVESKAFDILFQFVGRYALRNVEGLGSLDGSLGLDRCFLLLVRGLCFFKDSKQLLALGKTHVSKY
jgi:hypothetical protein